ncbi:MAG: DNA polymerase III subunit alpha [Alphaproteobacteria bacterium]
MAHADFVHLRVHSAYSLSEGALKISDIVKLCMANQMPAVAIADTGNLFGALEFAMACRDAGVQPIIGCQLALRRDDGKDRTGPNVAAIVTDTIMLLAQSEAGYRNLMALSSKAYLDTDPAAPPHVNYADLEAHNDGLLLLTGGGDGVLAKLVADNLAAQAEAVLARLVGIFPGRLYIEIARHSMAAERRSEAGLLAMAYKHNVPLVATNEAFFSDANKYEAHDALICIADGSFVNERERRRYTPEYRFKSAAEMRALFKDIPEAADNTLTIARRCAFMPEPRKPILPPFQSASGRSEPDELRVQAEVGLEERLARGVFTADMDDAAKEAAAKPYRDRLAFELDVIISMGFPGYFLIVADFIRWAKTQGIPVGPGRGSGAGSVVAWSLTITDLDPLRWGLLFERFLNPERISMPDFDIDFCQDRRDEVIKYVQAKYGEDKVAHIITFGKLQARAVLRDVGRVLQMPYGLIDKMCKLVPNNPAAPTTLAKAVEGEPQLQAYRDADETSQRLFDIALKLEGLYRNASTHAAGVVIGDRPLVELVPLYRDPRSALPATQFNMKYVETAGLVKFDFLGLTTLTVLVMAARLLAKRGVNLNVDDLPLDDRGTFDMLGHGDTTGVFQLESAGMRDVLRNLKPDRFEDIIAVVALYRPGPMENIPSYISRKHGREKPDYLHPSLEKLLKETYGIIIYQEQVMQIAQELSGYTLGGADLLRRAMGKKIKSEMEAQRATFVEGAVGRGVDKAKASHIFDLVDKFAGYGFNKSHAAAYALVAYQTAYLKANHPVEFFAASMTYVMGNADKLALFRRELGRLNIKLLPPDINRSDATFAVEQQPDGSYAIRYALAALKNVGLQAMRDLEAIRAAKGPFKSISDFAFRVGGSVANKRQIESLVRAGAFDSIHSNRKQLFEQADAIVRAASSAAQDRGSNQTSLFAGAGGEATAEVALKPMQDWSAADRLQQEFEAIGLYLSAHPLDKYEKSLAKIGAVKYADLPSKIAAGAKVAKLAGTVIGRKERTSQKGNRFAFVQLSDASGMYEMTVFSEVLTQCRELFEQSESQGVPLLITADLQPSEETIKLLARAVEPLDAMVAKAAAGLRVFVNGKDGLPAISSLIQKEKKGRGRFSVVVDLPDREIEVAVPGGFAFSPKLMGALKALPGVEAVEEL